MSIKNEPSLQAPGAGLPKAELFIARLLFAWKQLRADRKKVEQAFESERQKIFSISTQYPAEKASRRVLIKRIRGIEDSSRYWSVWMTLEHLRIVNDSIRKTVGLLAKGLTPRGKASTANVKPSPDLNESVINNFQASCVELTSTIAGIPDLKTTAKFAHPWFGPLDASGWHLLSATHMSIHRAQIEEILQLL